MPKLDLGARKLGKHLAAAIMTVRRKVDTGLGLLCHTLSVTTFVGLTEADPARTFFESGPSLFCCCCGERWHIFSHVSCPNGCPWVFSTFRAPAWAGDEKTLARVQRLHREAAMREDGSECWSDVWTIGSDETPRA